MKRRILVTDGDQRAALALVRSYGRAGHDVFVCATRNRSLAGASRYCSDQAAVPSALADPQRFINEVRVLLERWRIDVLIPLTEASLLAALPAKSSLRQVLVPFTDVDTFRRISDKEGVLAAAPQFGIAVPAQHVLECREQLAQMTPGSLQYPVVVKPGRSVSEHAGRRTKYDVAYAKDAAELEEVLDQLGSAAYPLLLQQRVQGPGVGIFLLIWNGKTIAVFAHHRLREKPPSGGVSVYRESVAADPRLVEQSVALLNSFSWNGVAMIEYKIDASTGTPYLMEINGRFWGSLQLAIDAGVDFPNLLLAAASGEQPSPVTDYRTGVRSRWWWGDVDHLLMRLLKSGVHLSLPHDAPSRGRVLLDFLRLWRPGDRNEILRWSDPAPLARETIDWLLRR